MVDLVWILNSEKSASFGNKGIFASYLIPKNDMQIDLQLLAGNRLWVVLRGQEDRLLQLIKIKKVERIIDGYHTGDFLISSELAESFKLVSGYSAAAKYKIMDTRSLKLGISELKSRLSTALHFLVKGMVQIKLTPPAEQLLDQINLQPLPSNNHQLARSALRAISSRLTLEQIWANGTGEKLGAFSNFSYALISRQTNGIHASNVINDLKNLDPISIIFEEEKFKIQDNHFYKKKIPRIDMEFTEIEPEKIYAREFLFVDSRLKNLEEALNKTEHAEKVHQAMLKDISLFLINQGIVPYESCSIDLMYNTGNEVTICEIKSASVDNILAQAAKGAFQLACYQNELIKDYDNLITRLILHKTDNIDIEEYAVAALLRLNINILFYDPSKPWPMRIHGMPL